MAEERLCCLVKKKGFAEILQPEQPFLSAQFKYVNKHESRHTFRGAVAQLSTSYRLRTAWLQTRTIDPLLSFYYKDGNQCPWCWSIQQWYLQVITCNALTRISSKSYSWYSVHAESDFGKIGRVTSARCVTSVFALCKTVFQLMGWLPHTIRSSCAESPGGLRFLPQRSG